MVTPVTTTGPTSSTIRRDAACEQGAGSPAKAVTANGLARGAVLGFVPAVIYGAHLFSGAVLDVPALILFSVLSALLLGALARSSSRQELGRLSPTVPLLLLFGLVIAAAIFSLTPGTPGGAHPIWAWAGFPPASSLNLSATILEIVKLFGLAAIFILGAMLGATADRARAALWLILCLGGVYGFACLVAFLGDQAFMRQGPRFAAGFRSANVAGTQFGVLAVLAVAWAIRQWRQTRSTGVPGRIVELSPVLALMVLFVVCLLLTASRAALSSTGLALAILVGWEAIDNRRSRWPLALAGCGLLLLAAVFLFQGNSLFLDRFETLELQQGTRAAVFEAHWRAFLASPLFGYGLGSFPQVNNMIMTAPNAGALSESVILHNAYLQWLLEAGLVGAVPLFLLIAGVLALTLWRAVRRPRNRTLVVGLLAASALVLVHATVDVSLNTPSFEAFWTLLLGMGFALSQAPSGRVRGNGTPR